MSVAVQRAGSGSSRLTSVCRRACSMLCIQDLGKRCQTMCSRVLGHCKGVPTAVPWSSARAQSVVVERSAKVAQVSHTHAKTEVNSDSSDRLFTWATGDPSLHHGQTGVYTKQNSCQAAARIPCKAFKERHCEAMMQKCAHSKVSPNARGLRETPKSKTAVWSWTPAMPSQQLPQCPATDISECCRVCVACFAQACNGPCNGPSQECRKCVCPLTFRSHEVLQSKPVGRCPQLALCAFSCSHGAASPRSSTHRQAGAWDERLREVLALFAPGPIPSTSACVNLGCIAIATIQNSDIHIHSLFGQLALGCRQQSGAQSNDMIASTPVANVAKMPEHHLKSRKVWSIVSFTDVA